MQPTVGRFDPARNRESTEIRSVIPRRLRGITETDPRDPRLRGAVFGHAQPPGWWRRRMWGAHYVWSMCGANTSGCTLGQR